MTRNTQADLRQKKNAARRDHTESIKRIAPVLAKDGSILSFDSRMADYTTFKIGGEADAFLEVFSGSALVSAVTEMRRNKIPYFMLGGGSNLLVNDSGIPGVVIKNRLKKITIIDKNSPETEKLEKLAPAAASKNRVAVSFESGAKLSEIVEFACENGLSGVEFMAGIPGTLGGAIFGNAGAYGKSVADVMLLADILTPDGKVATVTGDYFEFAYRKSRLKLTSDIVISAVLAFTEGDSAKVRAEVDRIIAERHTKHPPETIGSAGSYFKNVNPVDPAHRRIAAGYFLEQAGVKGLKYGNAEVYLKHANFIINPGGASSEEVLGLATMMKSKVLEKFGLLLEEEVQYVA